MSQDTREGVATESLAHLTKGHPAAHSIAEGDVHPPVLRLDELEPSTAEAIRRMPLPLHMQHQDR